MCDGSSKLRTNRAKCCTEAYGIDSSRGWTGIASPPTGTLVSVVPQSAEPPIIPPVDDVPPCAAHSREAIPGAKLNLPGAALPDLIPCWCHSSAVNSRVHRPCGVKIDSPISLTMLSSMYSRYSRKTGSALASFTTGMLVLKDRRRSFTVFPRNAFTCHDVTSPHFVFLVISFRLSYSIDG